MPVAQDSASISNIRSRCHVAFQQEVAAQPVGDLAGINPMTLFFRRGDGPQHQRISPGYLGRVGAADDPSGPDP